MIRWERDEGVGILRMHAGENRLNAAFLDALDAALDRAENDDIEALVTIGSERFYSTGLDLEWLAGDGRPQAEGFVGRLQHLFARLLVFPVATVAALNGHAFAGGAMLALCHDRRVMRSDRGYFCLPEIDLATGQPLTPGMVALIRMKLPPQTFHEAIVTGRRYGGSAAEQAGIVQSTASESDLLLHALDLARQAGGRGRETLATLKAQLAGAAIETLRGAPR